MNVECVKSIVIKCSVWCAVGYHVLYVPHWEKGILRTYLILFQAVLLLSKISSNFIGEPIERERLHDAADCLLSFEVRIQLNACYDSYNPFYCIPMEIIMTHFLTDMFLYANHKYHNLFSFVRNKSIITTNLQGYRDKFVCA